MISKKQISRIILAAMLTGIVGAVSAHQTGPGAGGWGMGPGMMGPGMMGPGMMGPGMGPGMMGPGMMGPGMGPGMMGPGMMGPGYMGPGNTGPGDYYGLDLSANQRDKIAAIQKQARKEQWDLMTQMREEQYKLQELYYSDSPDPSAINAQAGKIEQLQRKMIQANIEAQKRVAAVLTPEQRDQLQQWYGSGAMRGYR
ncbi:MAG: Spy/CpxP family protein refolding chaperone [Burkholderiales bacterium]|jgi:Spy/CpxP family protein refolding chaperone